MCERDTIATTEADVVSADEDGSRGALSGLSRGALSGLRRAWPILVCYGHCRIEAEEKSCPAAEEENCKEGDGTTDAAIEEEKAAG